MIRGCNNPTSEMLSISSSIEAETAMTWAESIEDERRRMWMMERVAATWKSQAPESFVNYLGASDLTDEQRERLGNAQLNRGARWGHRH